MHLYDVKNGMWNGMECGTEYGMDYGTYLVYHKYADYVATPINYHIWVKHFDNSCEDHWA